MRELVKATLGGWWSHLARRVWILMVAMACAQEPLPAAAPAMAALNSRSVYMQLNAGPPHARALADHLLASMDVAAYYQLLLTLSRDDPVAIDAHVLAGSRRNLQRLADDFSALGSRFRTAGDLWRAATDQPVSYTEFKDQLARAVSEAPNTLGLANFMYTPNRDCQDLTDALSISRSVATAWLTQQVEGILTFISDHPGVTSRPLVGTNGYVRANTLAAASGGITTYSAFGSIMAPYAGRYGRGFLDTVASRGGHRAVTGSSDWISNCFRAYEVDADPQTIALKQLYEFSKFPDYPEECDWTNFVKSTAAAIPQCVKNWPP